MTKKNTNNFDNKLEIEHYLNDNDVVKDLFIKKSRLRKHKSSKSVDKMKCKTCCKWKNVKKFNSLKFSDVSRCFDDKSNKNNSNCGDKLQENGTLKSVNKNSINKMYEENKNYSETNSFSKCLDKVSSKYLNTLKKNKKYFLRNENKRSTTKKLKCQCKYTKRCLNEILNVCTKNKKCRKKPMKIKTLHKNYTRFIAMKIKPKKTQFHCLW